MTEKWRRARDSNPQGPRGPVDFKSTALPVEASPPCSENSTSRYTDHARRDRINRMQPRRRRVSKSLACTEA